MSMDVLADTRRHTARKSTVTRLLQVKASSTHPPPLTHCENVIQIETTPTTTIKSSIYLHNGSVSSSPLNNHHHLSHDQYHEDRIQSSLFNSNSNSEVSMSNEGPSSIFDTLESSLSIMPEIKNEHVDMNEQQIKTMIIIPDNETEEVEDSTNGLFGLTKTVEPPRLTTEFSSKHVSQQKDINSLFDSSDVFHDIMENLKAQTELQIEQDERDNVNSVQSTITSPRLSTSTPNSNLLLDYHRTYSTDSADIRTTVASIMDHVYLNDEKRSKREIREEHQHSHNVETENECQNAIDRVQSDRTEYESQNEQQQQSGHKSKRILLELSNHDVMKKFIPFLVRTLSIVDETEVDQMDQEKTVVTPSSDHTSEQQTSSNNNGYDSLSQIVFSPYVEQQHQQQQQDDVCPMECDTAVSLASQDHSVVEVSSTPIPLPSICQSITVIDDDIVEIAITPATLHRPNHHNVILVRDGITNGPKTSNRHSSSCTCQCHSSSHRQSSDDDFHLFEQALYAQRQNQQQTLSMNDKLIKFLRDQQKEFQQTVLQKQQAKEHRSQQTTIIDVKETGSQTEQPQQQQQQQQQPIQPRQISQTIISPTVVTSSSSNPLIPPQLQQHTLQTAIRSHNPYSPFSITTIPTSIFSASPILSATLHQRPTTFIQPILPHHSTPLSTQSSTLSSASSVSPAQTVPSQHLHPNLTSIPVQLQHSQVTEIDLTNDDDDRPSLLPQTAIRPHVPQASISINYAVAVPPPPNRTHSGNRTFRANIIQTGQMNFPIRPLPEHQPLDTLIGRPKLTIAHENSTVRLHWNLQNTSQESIREYQIFAYKYNANSTVSDWKQIGSVRSMRLPMAVTLKEFQSNSHYAFAVRAVSISNTIGQFCEPKTIFTGISPNPLPLQTSQIQNVPIYNGGG
ncbi:unnamed protein product, partial [Didymodactylos carnosus]